MSRGPILHYYQSLKARLRNKFGPQIYLCPVYGDGNCLYRTLSHVIFGSESSYRVLKHSLISKFKSTPAHFYNVMRRSGIFSEQELIEHMDRVSVLNEWGTNTELNMIGALARINVLSINATDIDPHYWNIQPVYIHEQLEVPLECDPIYDGRKLGVLFHRIHHQIGMEHFDPFYNS